MQHVVITKHLLLNVATGNVLLRGSCGCLKFAGPLYGVALLCIDPELAEEWAGLIVWNEQRKASLTE